MNLKEDVFMLCDTAPLPMHTDLHSIICKVFPEENNDIVLIDNPSDSRWGLTNKIY